MLEGENWQIADYIKEAKQNIYEFQIEQDEIQKNYLLSDIDLKNIRRTISKRHSNDDWIHAIDIVIENQTKKLYYYDLDAIDWIVNVYFRDLKINYLNAEIKFEKKYISKLENILNVSYFPKYKEIGVYELSKKLGITYTETKRKMNVLNIIPFLDEDRKYKLTEEQVKLLIEKECKKYYFKKLNEYKISLKQQLENNNEEKI